MTGSTGAGSPLGPSEPPLSRGAQERHQGEKGRAGCGNPGTIGGADWSYDTTAEGDLPEHVERASRIVDQVAFREGAVTSLERISPVLERASLTGRDCVFPAEETSHVHCDVDRDETGRLRVELAYDIAL